MKSPFKILFGICAIGMMLIIINFIVNDIGVSESNIVADIQVQQYLPDDWITLGEISDEMVAYISYSPDKSDYTYSLYINPSGLSIGYFFRAGGDLMGIGKYIQGFSLKDYSEIAFISMNELGIERVEIKKNNKVEILELDSSDPFAIVLSKSAENITFFDINNNVVDYFLFPL